MGIGKILAAVTLIAAAGCGPKVDRLESWVEYTGKIPGYTVRINETNHTRRGRMRMIHLEATDRATIPYGVTEHDHRNDGDPESIFIRETEIHGCNALQLPRGWNGNVVSATWDPCNYDGSKGIPKPGQALVDKCRGLLDTAVREVRVPKYMKQHR